MKTGAGFYKRVKPDGESEILTLDVTAVRASFSPPTSGRLSRPLRAFDRRNSVPSTALAATGDSTGRLRTLFLAQDRVGALLRRTLGATLVYAARVAPEIAHSIDDVDRAMRWGFGWELGPFETWDAIGIETVLEACEVRDPPPLVRRSPRQRAQAVPRRRSAARGAGHCDSAIVERADRTVVKNNAGASLVDLGDGVLCVEFHSKMNAIGGDAIEMLQAGVARGRRRTSRRSSSATRPTSSRPAPT